MKWIIWVSKKLELETQPLPGSSFSPVSPLCFSWYVSFSISSHRPAMGMCSPTLEAPALWFHLPKMNPISSFDNHSKNSKAGFYLDHLGSSAKLCVNTLGSGRLRLSHNRGTGGSHSGCQGRAGELEWWGGRPLQVVVTVVLVTVMVLRSITAIRLSFAN